jgi:hypothetical protein
MTARLTAGMRWKSIKIGILNMITEALITARTIGQQLKVILKSIRPTGVGMWRILELH